MNENKFETDKIIHELKCKGALAPRLYKNISVLYVDFSTIPEDLSGNSEDNLSLELKDTLSTELKDILANFELILNKAGLEKLKISKNLWIIRNEETDELNDHAEKAINSIILMKKFLHARNKYAEIKWNIKAGISSGQVIAGATSFNKILYEDCWDTVSLAGCMEDYSEPDKINVSQSTYSIIKNHFFCEYCGKIPVNNDEQDMYSVKGVKKYLYN